MKLFLVRHGETEENIQGIIMGQTQGVLTALGEEQAKKVAKRLSQEKFDGIYSSDLLRAKKTADYIREYHLSTPFVLCEELRERSFGSLQGKLAKEINWDIPQKEVESEVSMRERARKILIKAQLENPNGQVLFVAHGLIFKAILAELLDFSGSIVDLVQPNNSAIYILEVDDNLKGKIIIENDDSHLKE